MLNNVYVLDTQISKRPVINIGGGGYNMGKIAGLKLIESPPPATPFAHPGFKSMGIFCVPPPFSMTIVPLNPTV